MRIQKRGDHSVSIIEKHYCATKGELKEFAILSENSIYTTDEARMKRIGSYKQRFDCAKAFVESWKPSKMNRAALELVTRQLCARYEVYKDKRVPAEKKPTEIAKECQFQLVECDDGTGLLFVSINIAVFCYKLNWKHAEKLMVFRGHSDPIETFYVDFERFKLITISNTENGQLRLWNIKTGQEVCDAVSFPSERRSFKSIQSIRYNKGILTFFFPGDSIVTLDTYLMPLTMCGMDETHQGAVTCIIYDPINERLFSGSADNTIRVWNPKTGKCVDTLKGHTGYVHCIAYDPKNDRLFSGSGDKTIRIRYPPYYHQRDRRRFDPNAVQTGLDAAMLWLYYVGLMATYAKIKDERLLESPQFVWIPRGIFVIFVLFYWIRVKGYLDFMEVGFWSRDQDEWRIGRVVPSWKRIIPETKPDAKPVAGDYVKVEIPTPRRKSQMIQKGKVQFTRLDDEEV
eukprot:g9006.t1